MALDIRHLSYSIVHLDLPIDGQELESKVKNAAQSCFKDRNCFHPDAKINFADDYDLNKAVARFSDSSGGFKLPSVSVPDIQLPSLPDLRGDTGGGDLYSDCMASQQADPAACESFRR